MVCSRKPHGDLFRASLGNTRRAPRSYLQHDKDHSGDKGDLLDWYYKNDTA